MTFTVSINITMRGQFYPSSFILETKVAEQFSLAPRYNKKTKAWGERGCRVLRDSITTSYNVGLAALGIGIMMNIGGLASAGWRFDGGYTMGLWMLCINDNCASIPDSDKKGSVKVGEASSILGIIFNGFAFVLAATFLVLSP
ncbi:unnamed protein product [Lymnaea stagnalis]|uniref:Uncharacterized protein n=1 Tax=Lymnaea stagnalis TaxID=6523 RepID=A0AAV2INN3_LYMST